jgi:hypothetical protein
MTHPPASICDNNHYYRKRFVRCVDNLKAIMMLLRESRSPITQYEVCARAY